MRDLLLLAAVLLLFGAAVASQTTDPDVMDVLGLGFAGLGVWATALLVGD